MTDVKEQVCITCGKNKKIGQYYLSYSPLFSSTKRVPICKNCIKKNSVDENGSIDIDKFHNILRQIDKPFLISAYNSACSEESNSNTTGKGRTDVIGIYFKNIQSLPQYKHLTYNDSETKNKSFPTSTGIVKKSMKHITTSNENFEVTEEMIDLFGEGFQANEYRLMQKKFNKMSSSYSVQTNLHEEALATYVRFKVKEELATAAGHVADADKWNKAAQDAADKAKLTPKQLTQADLQGGLNSFSEIFKAVEQAIDVVPILPRFKARPNDSLDFVIWCYINYVRNLQGLPECEYEDIYKFYDRKKDEYLEQYGDPYGIFDEDPTLLNRETIKKFITLPNDYEDGD